MSFTSLSLRVLNAYHPRLYTLCEYITVLVAPQSAEGIEMIKAALLREDDPVSYNDFLTKTYVADSPESDLACGSPTPLKLGHPFASMAELIDRAQEKLFTCRKKGRPTNIITSGYRFGGYRYENGKGASGSRAGVTNFFVNTMITALKTADWTRLLNRCGDAVILHLLAETSIYVSLPNDCFCQLTGPQLIYLPPPKALPPINVKDEVLSVPDSSRKHDAPTLKRKVEGLDSSTRPLKRLKTTDKTTLISRSSSKKTVRQPKTRSPADIPLARMSMFYTRPCRRLQNSPILLGLPSHHILNKMATTKWRKEMGLIPDSNGNLRSGDRDGAFEARHLSKYIFPLQYKLSSVFTVPTEKLKDEQFERRYLSDREAEIKAQGSTKTPSRLKDTTNLLGRLYRKHTKCGYKALLDKTCPSKLTPSHKDASIDSSIVLELIAEESTQGFPRSQALEKSILGSMSDTSAATMRRISLPKSQSNHKPKFAEFMCSHAQVFLYVRAITKAVIPNDFWGCYRNRRTILHHVKQLITGRRYEVMTLHGAMQGMSTSECDWLLPPQKPGQQYYHSAAESLKRRELLEEFIFWYLDQFVLPLLKTTFYITESSAFRKRVLYFRHDDWDVLCRPLLDRLASTTFQRITQEEAHELLKQRKLGYSFVRLLPKDSGVRPIVNLRRKAKKSSSPYEQNQSINQILSVAFSILTYEKESQAELLGASVFGPNEVYHKLKEFKRRIGGVKKKLPKLYFVKVDVQACFDTIEQDKLLGILKSIISEDAYLVQKHGQVMSSIGKIKRLYERKAMPEPDHPDFLTHAMQLASLLHHTIFVDQVVYPIAYQGEIIELLEDHITSNIVKIGDDYYRQHIGIPQGSVLSSLLCSFFYGDLERTCLSHLYKKDNNVLLRLIDDYLFITTEENDAKTFLETMKRGHPEYGCFISKEKTLTNLEHGAADISELNMGGVLDHGQKSFPWCGYLIDIKDLSVMTDYSRFHDDYLIDSLTVERGRRPNSAFVQKTIQTAMAKSHPIYTDLAINSPRVVYQNVHQAFVLAAMKMHAYIKAVGKGRTSRFAFVPRAYPPGFCQDAKRQGDCDRTQGRASSLYNRQRLREDGQFLLDTIKQSIRYTYSSMNNKLSRHSAKLADNQAGTINKAIVEWLGAHAFYNVLSLKRTAYSHTGVLFALQQDVVRQRYRNIRRTMTKLASESLKIMLKDVKF